MALIPLNSFKTKTAVLTTNTTATIYTAPIGVTSIILMAQISNISTTTQICNVAHYRRRPVLPDAQGNGGQPGNTISFLVKEFPIPESDAASILVGKLVIESLDSIRAFSSSPGTLQVVLSVLETANA